jgi:2-keto-4-pentenoate hydratase/2-oxohepta-3-ene-1,7-dioic acid hydratase in catechol pathway
MKFVTFREDKSDRIGVFVGDSEILDLTRATGDPCMDSMLELIEAGPPALETATRRIEEAQSDRSGMAGFLLPVADVQLRAPIPRPRKNVICVGLNYRSHVEQNAVALGQPFAIPELPLFFSKPVTAVVGPGEAILRDRRLTSQLDYEIELAVVIGRRGSWISPEHALEHVFGFTIVNDVSARDLQWRTSQFFIGKGLDSYCPMGPAIITKDQMPDFSEVVLELRVNGQVRQQEAAGNMIFSLPNIISELSKGMTLEAGDVVSLGTPGGCGYQMQPAVYLQPGDAVECLVEPIGILANPVVEGATAEMTLSSKVGVETR